MSSDDDNRTAECLSTEDFARHQRMLGLLRDAESLVEQARRAQQRAGELQAAVKIWVEELHDRYELAVDGSEGVTADGTVTRRALPAAPQPAPDAGASERTTHNLVAGSPSDPSRVA